MPDSANPWTADQQAPLHMGFPRQEHWNGLPFPSSGDLPDPGIESASPALVGEFFTVEPPGTLPRHHHQIIMICTSQINIIQMLTSYTN